VSTAIDSATPNSRSAAAKMPDAPRPRGRMLIGITLIVALALSAVLQQAAYSFRSEAINRNRSKNAPVPSRVANLDSFSLALLLGGLRGPLVMFLWTSSESQKSEKDLESFDTKVEWIRLLQPEFVTVHLFQMWNLAYNVSAQLASLSNKYGAVLQAVDYGEKTLQFLPDDINIVAYIGSLYSDKLGNSAEKDYYRPRVRAETLPMYRITFPAAMEAGLRKAVADSGLEQSNVRVSDDAGGGKIGIMDKPRGDRVRTLFNGANVTWSEVPRQSLQVQGLGGRRTEMDTLLDGKGYILPELLKPTRTLQPGVVDNDGSELQFLARFQPYPYGISPIALGYNYAKRAQLLQRVEQQKHVNLSPLVVDHQPALTLKFWADEEWDRGRRLEQRGLPPIADADNLVRELRTSTIGPDASVVDRASIDQAIFSYQRAADVDEYALVELIEHVANFPRNIEAFNSSADTIKATLRLNRADATYLQAIIAQTPQQRKALLEQAKAEYQDALKWFQLLDLKYYVFPTDAQALKYSRDEISDKMSNTEMNSLFAKTMAYLKVKFPNPNMNPAIQDLREYNENIQRITDRLNLLK
jgi:hypothetical protein